MEYLNLAFYRFFDLGQEALPALRAQLLDLGLKHELKGTILIAPEGLNAFVAGARERIASFRLELVVLVPQLAGVDMKESVSDHQPFSRMLVRIKKEIITMGRPDVSPARFTGPRLSARELKTWIDEGRELVFLDTRNDYEVRLGTFESAIDLKLKTFRQFPERILELPAELKEKTVVSFCTGGIRCEKASALLLKEGFKNVYQLDGGILKYFEEVGGTHYNGECFVFDHRVALDSCLRETGAVLCYNCQNPVTADEQKSPQYVFEASCPHCHGKPKEHKEQIAAELKKA